MEIQQLNPQVWVVRGAVNQGLVLTDSGLVAIDTGLDKQAAKNLIKAAGEIGHPLGAIVNTHAHADHFGGNEHILSRFDIPVHAPGVDAPVIRRPRFEPEYLWGGATPLPELMGKFLCAGPSRVDVELEPDTLCDIGGASFQIVGLPGHSHGQAGVLVHGVFFVGDAYFDATVTEKHGVPYLVDFEKTQMSAQKVAEEPADWYVPGHGTPTSDPVPHVAALMARHEQAFEHVATAIHHGRVTLDDIIEAVCHRFQLTIQTPTAYALLRASVGAYATAGVERGIIELAVENGRMTFF